MKKRIDEASLLEKEKLVILKIEEKKLEYSISSSLPLSLPQPLSLSLSLSLPLPISTSSISNQNIIRILPEFPFRNLKNSCSKCGQSFLDLYVGQISYLEIKNEMDNDRNIIWCSYCNRKYHIKCTGDTYSPYVLNNENEFTYCCEFCLNEKANLPHFTTHLGPSIEALGVLSQVN